MSESLDSLNAKYKALTGKDLYLYTSRPGDGQVRYVFTDGVIRGQSKAYTHMLTALSVAMHVHGGDTHAEADPRH